MTTEKNNKGKIFSINLSKTKGIQKKPVDEINLIENHGLEGDAHSGSWHRQVSLLAIESIQKQAGCENIKTEDGTLKPGDFAENITTKGIRLDNLDIGSCLKAGKDAVLEITQIGKECPRPCSIYYRTGDCIMPREGIFARVKKGGKIKVDDIICLLS